MFKFLTLFFWFIFPMIILVASQFTLRFLTAKTKFSKINAPDIATFFLIFGIFEMTRRAFTNSILPNFALSLLLISLVVIAFQIYYYGEFFYGKFFKMFWRLTFLFTLVVYFICWLMLISLG
ncbi:MAG: DUF3397 domain-containing protein [Streptococcaceae bacterium]|nr:DUF3397 domain-containing protein [Streptococcaceae bacterium]